MPLFSSRRNNASSASADKPRPSGTPPSRRRGILSRRSRSPGHAEDRPGSTRSRSHDSNGSGSSRSNANGSHAGRGSRLRGLFGRRRALPSNRHGVLAHDQTLLSTRAKVGEAEAAERSADAALYTARSAIREAKDHVKSLEREALEEYGLS